MATPTLPRSARLSTKSLQDRLTAVLAQPRNMATINADGDEAIANPVLVN